MADTVQVDWLHPPNFENLSDDQRQGTKNYCVRLAGVSDGTGETDVRKVDISELRLPGGNRNVTRTSIQKIKYNVVGETIVLEWDRTPHRLIGRCSGEGSYNWEGEGGLVDYGDSGDGTGDILLTTVSHDSGDFYEITIWFKGKEDPNEVGLGL